jgi:hypothetical protein
MLLKPNETDDREWLVATDGRKTAIAGVLLALTLGCAAAAEPLRTLVSGTLRVGTYFVNPPFEYVAKVHTWVSRSISWRR